MMRVESKRDSRRRRRCMRQEGGGRAGRPQTEMLFGHVWRG